MTTMTQPVAPTPAAQRTFDNGQQWIESLGDVPLSRVIFNPLPGTATEQDLLRFVEVDNRLCELVDGTLVEKPVGYLESRVALKIGQALLNFVEPRGLGVVAGGDGTLRMASGNVRLPDVSFISVSDLPGGQMPTESIPTLPPTLAVEVLSPGNTVAEMRRKTREYFNSGSKQVWLVEPRARTVAIFNGPTDEPSRLLNEGDTLDAGEVIPGFALAVADLFRDRFARNP